MFESLRKNIQSVQDGITARLQRLSSGVTPTTPPEDHLPAMLQGGGADLLTMYQSQWATMHHMALQNAKLAQRLSSGVTPTTPPEGHLPAMLQGGGADLLTMYQSQWATMHHMALQNAKLAQAVADDISCLTEECETQHSQLLEVRSLLAHLPNIMAQLHSSLSTIGRVRSVLEEVETGLGELEAVMEEAALQEQVLDMKVQATLLVERRQHQLNMLHNELSAQHREKIAAAQRLEEEKRRQRLEAFSDQFQEDIQQYKETGTVADRASDNEPQWIMQEDVNDLSRDFYPSKHQSELLASWLKAVELGEGRYSSKQSLKAVLLHIGNKYLSIPISYSVRLKESYDNLELFLEAVKYNQYLWNLCRELKGIGLLMAMDKNGAAFQHLCTLFPALSSAKLKEGIFVGPQIREVLKDEDFEELLP
ncbi:hypothetical protein FHG87_014471 [Trinorchestia longiramus]|nr:hypothetical protein FHG87_014471 [Trinorchestia longiramus]